MDDVWNAPSSTHVQMLSDAVTDVCAQSDIIHADVAVTNGAQTLGAGDVSPSSQRHENPDGQSESSSHTGTLIGGNLIVLVWWWGLC